MSYWEVVPFDILTSILPYLDFDDSMIIHQLSGDECLKRRLQIENSNGHIWKFIYTQKFSRHLPIQSKISLEQRYCEYLDNRENLHNYDLLTYAAQKGYEILVERLMDFGVRLSSHPLNAASIHGHLHIVKYFVEYGQNRNIYVNYETAVFRACQHGHLEIVKYLFYLYPQEQELKNLALLSASKYGFIDIVKFLINERADIHTNDNTALMSAIREGHLDIAAYLRSLSD